MSAKSSTVVSRYPTSIDAEKGFLASFLIDSAHVYQLIQHRNVSTEWFWPRSSDHAKVFLGICEMIKAGKPIELLTVTHHFTDHPILNDPNPAAFITELYTFIPTAKHASYYIDILQEKMVKRMGILECERLTSEFQNGATTQETFDLCTKAFSIVKDRCEQKETRNHDKEELESFLQEMEDAANGKKKDGLFYTTFPSLDRESGGVARGELIVISGLSSTGKSICGVQMVQNAVFDQDGKGMIFTLEMPHKQCLRRMVANMGRVSLKSMRDGNYNNHEMTSFMSTYGKIEAKVKENKLSIRDVKECQMTPESIELEIRRRKKNYGLDMVLIDHLNLVDFGKRAKSDSRRDQDLEGFASTLKRLALELDIVVVLAAQSNKEGTVFDSTQVESASDAMLCMIPDYETVAGIRRVKGTKGIYVVKFRESRRGWAFDVEMNGQMANIHEPY